MPDGRLTIRERAVAAWPSAWQGQNLRDILVPRLRRGQAMARTAQEGPRLDPLHRRAADSAGYAGYTLAETKRALKRKEEPSYQGTFIECRRMASETRDLNMSLFLCRLADEVKADAREEDMK